MVPLVMSISREDNPSSAVEEFATHLSLYDDSFHFVERSAPGASLQISLMEDTKGSLPPSVFCPNSKNTDDVVGQVKVKRKCGRPRNPIPRHKRESHINAEHRRRGKIQDGFRTLKNIVPKYEQTSGRDSKADILFKAVDYCKLLQNDINELSSSMENLRAERDVLSIDIKNYKTIVPDLHKYDDVEISIDDRYTQYVQQKTKENWAFGTFKVIMSPLFESYKRNVRSQSMEEFVHSVTDWLANSLTLSNLRTVCLTALRDVPTEESGAVSPYSNHLVDACNVRSTGSGLHPLMSDSNNNNSHCLNTQVLTSEHFNCRDSVSSVNSNSGTGNPVRTQLFGNAFDGTQFTPNSTSPLIKGGSGVSKQYHQDLVPVSGSNLNSSNSSSSIFSDLYYNIDHDLQHHLSLARADISGSDPWSNHCFQQQQWYYYHNHHYPSPSHFHDFQKVPALWGTQHQQLCQTMAGELSPEAAFYYHKSHSLTDRDFRYDLANARELSQTMPYPGYPAHFLDYEHGRHKRPSQSSSESDGSLLSMETFTKQATDTLAEQDKFSQLSPSTDSCISPGSSMLIPSPGLLNGRHSDYTLSHHSSTSLDHFKQYKPTLHDNLDSQLALTLPSYKDTFGTRAAENSARLEDIRPHWGSSKNSPGPGARQLSSERFEPPTLLAEMLGQQPTLLQTRKNPSRDNIEPSPHPNRNITPSNIYNPLPAKLSPLNKVTGHVTNGLRVSVKQECDYRLPSFPAAPGMESTRELSPLSPKDRQHSPSNVQSDATQGKCLTAQTTMEVTHTSNYNSNWLQPKLKLQDSPSKSNSTSVKPHQNDSVDSMQHQICYFEMAHQQLLKHHSLSLENMKSSKLKSSNISESQEQIFPPLPARDNVLSSEDPASNVQIPPSSVQPETALLGQSNHLRHSVQPQQSSRERMLKQKFGRKCFFEDGPAEESLQAVSECKKICQWENVDRNSEDLFVKGKLETIRESAYLGKLGLPSFGETVL